MKDLALAPLVRKNELLSSEVRFSSASYEVLDWQVDQSAIMQRIAYFILDY